MTEEIIRAMFKEGLKDLVVVLIVVVNLLIQKIKMEKNGQAANTKIYMTMQRQINFRRGHLGDGTKEFGPFYQLTYNTKDNSKRYIRSYNEDVAFFVSSYSPWFVRWGNYTYGTETGIAAYVVTYCDAGISNSFRIVLTP